MTKLLRGNFYQMQRILSAIMQCWITFRKKKHYDFLFGFPATTVYLTWLHTAHRGEQCTQTRCDTLCGYGLCICRDKFRFSKNICYLVQVARGHARAFKHTTTSTAQCALWLSCVHWNRFDSTKMLFSIFMYPKHFYEFLFLVTCCCPDI